MSPLADAIAAWADTLYAAGLAAGAAGDWRDRLPEHERRLIDAAMRAGVWRPVE